MNHKKDVSNQERKEYREIRKMVKDAFKAAAKHVARDKEDNAQVLFSQPLTTC